MKPEHFTSYTEQFKNQELLTSINLDLQATHEKTQGLDAVFLAPVLLERIGEQLKTLQSFVPGMLKLLPESMHDIVRKF